MKKKSTLIIGLLLVAMLLIGSLSAQQTARTVRYHANDIVSVHAKMRYTTLIQLPASEKILEVATGDKNFWIIDVVNNFCFLHPAKEGIHSNLNLITDKANVYSFTLDDVETADPDLKIVVEPSDPSSIAVTNGATKLVPANEVAAAQQNALAAENRAKESVEQFRSAYPVKNVKFDYVYKNENKNDKQFDVTAIFEDGQFTYIKSSAPEKFSVYEVKDGKPSLVSFHFEDGTYVVSKVLDHAYLESGKHRLNFDRQGN